MATPQRRIITVHDPLNTDRGNSELGGANDPKIMTMAKKVAFEAAIPGTQPVRWYRERGVNNLPPITVEGQADAIVECVKAGASVVHIHPRDPGDGLVRVHATDLMSQIVDRARKEVDFITAPHTWAWDFTKHHAVEYISYTEELLKHGKGNTYCEAALVMTMGAYGLNQVVMTRTQTREGVQYLESVGVKPMYSMQAAAFTHYKHVLWDSGASKWDPYWITIQMGKHTDDQVFSDPWSYLQVINNISMIRECFPDAFIGVNPAGRNWLPVAVVAMLYGAEFIRVGIEDLFYLYPHRDDISQNASDSTKIVANIARNLGREVATAQDVRERCKMKPPSR